MTSLQVGDPVTVLDRETARAVAARARPFIDIRPRRGRTLNPRYDKDGNPVVDVLWGWAYGSRVRALFPEKEGLNWCRGHVDGSHLEAAWQLARSAG